MTATTLIFLGVIGLLVCFLISSRYLKTLTQIQLGISSPHADIHLVFILMLIGVASLCSLVFGTLGIFFNLH